MADSSSSSLAYSLETLNHMSQDEFTCALGAVFENTPAIAHRAWHSRPFSHVEEIHDAMVETVKNLSPADQLALIRAHPDLGSRAQMAEASVKEQAEAGLTQLTPNEYKQIQQLNQRYKDRFQFPFIIAVKRHTKASIFENFKQRLINDPATERETALSEICHIARLRLMERIDGAD